MTLDRPYWEVELLSDLQVAASLPKASWRIVPRGWRQSANLLGQHDAIDQRRKRLRLSLQIANERASWTPTCRFGWPARFGETLATKKWWIHLPSEAKSTTSLCGSSAPLLLHRLLRGLCLVLDVLSR